MARFEPVLGLSKLTLYSQSSYHPIHTSTDRLEGFLEAEVNEDGTLAMDPAPKGHLEVYVDDLKSDYDYIDRVVQKRLDTRRFPRIKADLIDIRPKEGGHYSAAGEVSFHGVTKRLENDMLIVVMDQDTVRIEGEIKVDVRDHGVTPPTLLTITVEPEVRVRLDLVVKRVGK